MEGVTLPGIVAKSDCGERSMSVPLLPRIRIVVPAYKSGKTVAACVTALSRSAQGLDHEIFVVDDGGHSDLQLLLGGLCVTVLHTGGCGSAAAARNLGARGFGGDILVFVDADVVVERDALRNLLAPLAEGCAEAAIGNYTDDVAGLSFGTSYKQLYVACIYRRRVGYVVNDFWTAVGAVSRPVFDALGGFDSRFKGANGEDADLGMRMTRAGHRILAVPDALGQHRHEQTISGIVGNDWRKGVLALRQCQAGQRALSDNLHATRRDVASVLLAGATLAGAVLGLCLGGSGPSSCSPSTLAHVPTCSTASVGKEPGLRCDRSRRCSVSTCCGQCAPLVWCWPAA